MSRIGLDCDGVLADFNNRFIDRVVAVTGRDLFPSRPFDIPTWDYPQFYGYTNEETKAVWRNVTADPGFWRHLDPYKGTADVLRWLRRRSDDIYFVTSRPGVKAKQQTENWLTEYGYDYPTVLISSEKGMCSKALKLDFYIDDRDMNVIDVVRAYTLPDGTISPDIPKIFLLDQPWNRTEVVHGAISGGVVRRVHSVADALDAFQF